MILRKFLFQRTVMPYSATPPNPAIAALVEPLVEVGDVADRRERHALAAASDAGDLRRQRLDLQPVDRGDEMAVVHQVMRQVEPGRPEADDQHLVARLRLRQRPAQVSGFQRVSSP